MRRNSLRYSALRGLKGDSMRAKQTANIDDMTKNT